MATKGGKNKKDKITEKEAIAKVSEFRTITEANIVSLLWKNPELYFVYDELSIDTFKSNRSKVYFQIGYDITVKEKKTLEPITISMYLEKHPKLSEKYESYGGYDITKIFEYIEESNMDGYIEEVNKWNILDGLYEIKFPIADRLSDYLDMSCEDIYDENEALLNHIFVNVNQKDKAYKIGQDIYELIDKMDEGMEVGLPYHNMPLFTNETGGLLMGNMNIIAGLSGTGKSSLVRNAIMPSVIEHDERIVIIINEEDLIAVQKNLIVWVANNIFGKDVQKYKLKNGGYSPDFKKFLKDGCAKWIKDREDSIIILPLSSYSCTKVTKIIKKYASLGVKYFVLDTFKKSNDVKGDNTWESMMDDAVKLYDTIKPANLNVSLTITAQIKKSASRNKALGQGDLGMSTNTIDVCSMGFFTRVVTQDEMSGGKNELKVFVKTGKNNLTKKFIKLDNDKHYICGSFAKNRHGGTDLSIIFEHDLSRNVINELGYAMCVDNMV